MRFMVIVKATEQSEAGVMPSAEMLNAMGSFNQEMIDAGIFVEGAGLKPTSNSARIKFTGGRTSAIDGPFTETKELIAGFWILDCKSIDEVKEWMLRCPNPYNQDGEIEIRPFYEAEDFPYLNEEVAAAKH